VVYELKEFGVSVEIVDPYADASEVLEEYGYQLQKEPSGDYHSIIVAVGHDEYAALNESDFQNMLVPKGIVVDLKGIFRNRINQLNYWSL